MNMFDRAFDLVIGAEGGYVNDPRDPGGETKYGISKRAYPDLNIKELTIDEARKIYERDYWLAAKCNEMPESIAIAVFDSAVNQGIKPATRMLQRSLKVKEDGVMGPVTIASMRAVNEKELLINFLAERAIHYSGLSTFDTYGRGWMRRLFSVCRSA